ncbi:MAG: TonB-dependent receptor, partial [Pseudomonadota bacterium]
IRGINGARDAEASFAFVLDGILYSNPSSFNREFSDLSQIEILKGPQGAIYGRNAAAGAIVVSTNRPGNELEAEGEASFANEGTYFVSGTVGGPIIEDKLAFRINGNYRTSDGFFFNSFQNAEIVDDFENYNVNARMVYTPTSETSIDFRFRFGEVQAGAITFNAAFALPAFAGALGVPELDEDVNDHNFVFQTNIDPQNDQRVIEASVKLDHDFEFATLTTWFLYSEIDQSFSADGTSGAFGFFNDEPNCEASTAALNAAGVVLPPPQILGEVPESVFGVPNGSFFGPYTPTTCDGTQFQVRDQQDFSFEIRLASRDDQRFRWSVGFYYLNIDRQVGFNLGIDTGQGILPSLINGPDSVNPTEQLLFDDFDTDVFAGFGAAEYDILPNLQASVALRYDREERDTNSLVPTDITSQFLDFDPSDGFTGGAPLNPGLNPAINPTGVLPPQSATFDQVEPKVTLSWQATDEWTFFANWGIGFKSGGFNNQGSAATIDLFINDVIAGVDPTAPPVIISDIFDEETSSAFEVGFKGRLFDGRVQVQGAAYYTDVDDLQFFEFFVGPFGLLRVVSNIDDVEIFGGELSVNANVTSWLNVYGGVNITESEIQANSSRPDTVGNESPYTPDYTINLGADVRYPITERLGFVARVDARITGPTWFHTVQDQTRPTIFGVPGDFDESERDTFTTVDIRAGIEGEWWSVIGFARNVGDVGYLAEVIPAPEFGGSFISPADLRLYGVEVRVRY